MPILEIIGSSDPLGQWDTSPQTASFSVGEENTPESIELVYRVNLPDNMDVSHSALAENLASFESMKAALERVPIQLDDLARRAREKQSKAASGVSFSLAELQPEPGPEGELLSLLAITDSVALSGTGPEGVSFGLLSEASEVLGQAKQKYETLLEQVNREVLQFAWVEMRMADQLIARTKMGWSASHTIWTKAISTEHTVLHKRTLKVVSLTRNLKLRLLLTVAVGAVKVAPLMLTSGGTALAVPAVYGYVKSILENVKQLRSAQSLS
jgi:hypothetical protein